MKTESLPRIRLSTLLILIACAAVGLATTRDPLSAIWPAMEAAMVIGLLQEVRELRRWRPEAGDRSSIQFARAFAVVWRVAVAAAMAFNLTNNVSGWRFLSPYPDRANIVPYEPYSAIFDLLPIIVLANSVRRWRYATDTVSTTQFRCWLVVALVALLAVFNVIEMRFIDYLVHRAVAGMESSITPQFQRPGVYPNHASESFRSFWIALAASITVPMGIASLIAAARRWRSASGMASALIFVVYLVVQLFFCWWFYGHEFHRVSPELAGAGFALQSRDFPAVGVLIVAFATMLAYFLSAWRQNPVLVSANLAEDLDGRAIHETSPCVALTGLAAAISLVTLFVELLRSILFPIVSSSHLNTWMRLWMDFSLLVGPLILLALAKSLFAFQLCVARWRRRKEPVPWNLRALPPSAFARNWIAIAVAILLGVPTLGAFGFMFWLGPFNFSGF